PADPPFASDRCGTCSRCIEACPTGCILPDRTLDAGRCISYLTIEEKGAAPEPLRYQLQDWLFGCDICQEVCPWNQRFARPVGDPAFEPRALLESPRLEAFLRLEPGSWRDSLRGSPLERPRRRGLVRNAALVAGNTARADLLSILERILLEDPEPILREQAAWSIARIAGSGAGDILQSALAREENEAVRLGILRALKRAAQA
ncbi:MAG: epoxyqueuosine reductase, partial [Anaerolineales bacterium]